MLQENVSHMTGAHSDNRLGIAFVIAAAVAWSTAPFFTPLLPFDPWTILFWRGLFGGCSILVFLVALQGRGGMLEIFWAAWSASPLRTTSDM